MLNQLNNVTTTTSAAEYIIGKKSSSFNGGNRITVSLSDNRLREMLIRYIRALQTSATREHCTCEWVMHPDDTDKPAEKQRLRILEENQFCPVHTFEGRMVGFFDWMTENV